jgi:hypothetical protein
MLLEISCSSFMDIFAILFLQAIQQDWELSMPTMEQQ